MPLSVPNLDDRNFTDLVAEARSMVTRHAPQWTNHNPSDPGITLIELLAYVSEILIYRLNRVTRDTKLKFLQLLLGVTSNEVFHLKDKPLQDVDEALRQAVRKLQQLQRAVTAQDYEKLIKTLPRVPDQPKVARSKCFSGMNLASFEYDPQKCANPGHFSVVIVPGEELSEDQLLSLLKDLQNQLEPMRLLTTRLHIVKPFYLFLSLGAEIRLKPHAGFDVVRDEAIKKIQKYFDPRPREDRQHAGWPFGRPVNLSEVYALLEEVPGIDYVRDVRVLHLCEKPEAFDREDSALGVQIGVPAASKVGINTRLGGATSGNGQRLISDDRGTLIAVALRPYELVRVVMHEAHLLDVEAAPRPFYYT